MNTQEASEFAHMVRQWQSVQPQRGTVQNRPALHPAVTIEPAAMPTSPPVRQPFVEPPRVPGVNHPADNPPPVPTEDGDLALINGGMFDSDDLQEALMLQSLFDMASDQPPPAPVAERPLPPPEPRNWRFAEMEDNAASFNQFQERVAETAEYVNPASRPGLTTRVDALIADMRAVPTLRAMCFSIAADATQSCGDRIALALNDMQLAHIDHKANAGIYSMRELFSMGEGFFKLAALDQFAVEKIGQLTRAGVPIDAIEIRLAYQTELSDRLELPGVARSMLYRGCASVTAADIFDVEREILQKCRSGESVDFLVKWRPWQQALERTHPADFRRLHGVIQVERDAIASQPPRMTDQQWMDAFDRQAAIETSLTAATTDRLTRAFMVDYDIE